MSDYSKLPAADIERAREEALREERDLRQPLWAARIASDARGMEAVEEEARDATRWRMRRR